MEAEMAADLVAAKVPDGGAASAGEADAEEATKSEDG
jgi:hypothetical protein